MLRTPLPEIPAFKTPNPLMGDSMTTIAAVPSMARPALASLEPQAHSKTLPAGKGTDLAGRRSVSMGSQALQASISQKLKLLDSVPEAKLQKVRCAPPLSSGLRGTIPPATLGTWGLSE